MPIPSPPSSRSTSSTSLVERLFVWGGGAAFVASLAFNVFAYTISWSTTRPLATDPAAVLLVNTGLFAVFAAHHSLFARDFVKSRLARVLPERLLRAVYVWVASLLWMAVIAAWQPVGGVAYEQRGLAGVPHIAAQLAGLWLIWQSVRVLDPLALAGIRAESIAAELRVGGPYHLVRHPLYLGWILLVFGAAVMTGDRLAFATMSVFYLILAIPWEERALARAFGDAYRKYQLTVRWRVLPFIY